MELAIDAKDGLEVSVITETGWHFHGYYKSAIEAKNSLEESGYDLRNFAFETDGCFNPRVKVLDYFKKG